VTLREHASFVELPDSNFQPRIDDPRAGYGGLTFLDYSAPITDPIQGVTSASIGCRRKIPRRRRASR